MKLCPSLARHGKDLVSLRASSDKASTLMLLPLSKVFVTDASCPFIATLDLLLAVRDFENDSTKSIAFSYSLL